MSSCKKGEIGEIESVKLFDKMKKNGISVYKTPFLSVYVPANSFTLDRNLTNIGAKIVNIIDEGVKKSERLFIFFQLTWDVNSNKHSTVLDIERVDDVINMRYFDPNGKLETRSQVVELQNGKLDITPKYKQDYNVNALLSKLADLLTKKEYVVNHEQVMDHNINFSSGAGICDSLSLFYVKVASERDYGSVKSYFNQDIVSMTSSISQLNSTIVSYLRS
jgi:hypothetical protein